MTDFSVISEDWECKSIRMFKEERFPVEVVEEQFVISITISAYKCHEYQMRKQMTKLNKKKKKKKM